MAFILDSLFQDCTEDFSDVMQLTGRVLEKEVENTREVLEPLK